MELSAYHLLSRNPNPSEREIRESLSGNLCRCTGYTKIVEAIATSADKMKPKKRKGRKK
jgi:carbon-monoxide dehydrogenase small subunit